MEPDVCMHAVSQGALGVECRSDDLTVVRMLNALNHEETILACIAERTLLAKLEGGCSAPIAAETRVTAESMWLEGAVFDLDGTRRIQDRFEIKLEPDNPCPVVNLTPSSIIAHSSSSSSAKRKLDELDDDENQSAKKNKSEKNPAQARKSYSFILDLNIKECRMIKAELCGLHLAEKLKDKGADVLINEIKAQIHKTSF